MAGILPRPSIQRHESCSRLPHLRKAKSDLSELWRRFKMRAQHLRAVYRPGSPSAKFFEGVDLGAARCCARRPSAPGSDTEKRNFKLAADFGEPSIGDTVFGRKFTRPKLPVFFAAFPPIPDPVAMTHPGDAPKPRICWLTGRARTFDWKTLFPFAGILDRYRSQTVEGVPSSGSCGTRSACRYPPLSTAAYPGASRPLPALEASFSRAPA